MNCLYGENCVGKKAKTLHVHLWSIAWWHSQELLFQKIWRWIRRENVRKLEFSQISFTNITRAERLADEAMGELLALQSWIKKPISKTDKKILNKVQKANNLLQTYDEIAEQDRLRYLVTSKLGLFLFSRFILGESVKNKVGYLQQVEIDVRGSCSLRSGGVFFELGEIKAGKQKKGHTTDTTH